MNSLRKLFYFGIFFFFCLPLLYGEWIYTTQGKYFEQISTLSARGGKKMLYFSNGASVPLKSVVKITYKLRATRPLFFGRETVVALKGGDFLKGRLVKGGSLDITLAVKGLGQIPISLDYIDGIFFLGSLKSPGLRRTFLRESLAGIPKKDLVILKKGGLIPCVLQSILPQSIRYEVGGLGSRKMDSKKILALRIAPLGGAFRPPTTPYVRLYLNRGEVISGTITHCSANQITLKTFFGKTLSIQTSRLWEIYFFQGQFQYLSDIKPSKVEVTPGMSCISGLSFPPKRDRNVMGRDLKMAGLFYSKGLGIHSQTHLTYQLSSQYTSLQGKLGFDDSIQDHIGNYIPKVRIQIYGDGKKLYSSGLFTPQKKVIPLKIPLTGVKILRIEVNFGEPYNDVLGRIDFVDTYLVRKK